MLNAVFGGSPWVTLSVIVASANAVGEVREQATVGRDGQATEMTLQAQKQLAVAIKEAVDRNQLHAIENASFR